MCPHWHTRQLPVNREWIPPHCSWLRLDPAWHLARRAVRFATHVRGDWMRGGRAG